MESVFLLSLTQPNKCSLLTLLQECYKGPKFGFENDEDTFTLIIKKPETNDSGRYTCTVRECNDLSTKAYLEVERKLTISDPDLSLTSPSLHSPRSRVWIQEEVGPEEEGQDQEEGRDEVHSGQS